MRVRRVPLYLCLAIGLPGVLSDRALAERPGDVRAEAIRLFEAGDYRASLAPFDDVVRRKPRDLEARTKRGIAHLRLNQPAQATADFDAVIKITPWSYGLHIDRGIARVMLGEYEEARKDFDQRLHSSPSPSNAILPASRMRTAVWARSRTDSDRMMWRSLNTRKRSRPTRVTRAVTWGGASCLSPRRTSRAPRPILRRGDPA